MGVHVGVGVALRRDSGGVSGPLSGDARKGGGTKDKLKKDLREEEREKSREERGRFSQQRFFAASFLSFLNRFL